VRSVKICCSLFWLLFSAVMSREAFRLPMGEMRDPGAGFFPLLIALVTGLLALIALIQSLRAKKEKDEAQASRSAEPFRWWNLAVILVALVAYALTLTTLGFMINTFLFMLILLKVIEPQTWKKAILAAVITAVASDLFFNVLLQAQIPSGILGF
jgi:putative tricarboxylic transport membrane protein